MARPKRHARTMKSKSTKKPTGRNQDDSMDVDDPQAIRKDIYENSLQAKIQEQDRQRRAHYEDIDKQHREANQAQTKMNDKMALIKQKIALRRTTEGERQFQEECKKVREANEKKRLRRVREAKKAAEKLKPSSTKSTVLFDVHSPSPARYTNASLTDQDRENIKKFPGLAKALNEGLEPIEDGVSDRPKTDLSRGLEDALIYGIDDENPDFFDELLNIFHDNKDATSEDLDWFLRQVEAASKYISAREIVDTFGILIRTFTINVDKDGEHFDWFLREYGTKILEGHTFKNLWYVMDDSWELEDKLTSMGAQKGAIEDILSAMGGVASVEDDDSSSDFDNTEDGRSDDIDRDSDISDDASDIGDDVHEGELDKDEVKGLMKDLKKLNIERIRVGLRYRDRNGMLS